MKKSDRNKTIDISIEEGSEYLYRCLDLSSGASLKAFDTLPIDKTLIGDSLKIAGILPEHSIDIIIADPPYNLNKSFSSSRFRRMSAEEYESYTWTWMNSIKPLLKESGSIYVCCDWESSLIIGRVIGEQFKVRNRITWQREKGRGASDNWKNSMEDIWYATVSDDFTFNLDAVKQRRQVIAPYKTDGKPKDWKETGSGRFRDTCPSNFWDDITVPFWSMAENTAHPTQKPEKLIAKLLLASSNEGDIVFDPFLGSGTTSVTAKKLGRHYIGIERDKKYCIWAEKRLENADFDKRIQGFDEGVFWERNARR